MGSGSSKAADAIADIQRTMARQAKGNFTMPEVADVLAAANSFDAYRFLTNEMHPAARAGALTLTNPEFGGPLVGRDCMVFHDWVTPANLDAWLERAGFPFRWPLNPEPQAAAPAPVVAGSAEQRQARRWQMCLDAGLSMPQDTYAQLPRGIKEIAKAENITRQALAQDLSAHRERLYGR
ncbi:MAG: hypothetical protein B7Y20_10705 [Acidovorax sp. 16-64-162]|nr:MAG: hypothetical protein B7Y64_10310 [Acidovorax sp. 35-64-16]OYY86977.1 MAG: hypothetical protein B7Y46_03465 [Acidovorax sp. 28-64-14]OYZ44588.1 MAG: hypothetical protein B7Y20_10705 [Acidovorax sp. 16-64-162]OYZ68244.1 MAG: hypothetical protein B7Y14_11920 [Acidovorax sp. 24-64-9]OZA69052.1 MAG: hypothetical protein B7X70_12615 [Acidovorax sp. 39-64-12]